MSSTYAGDSTNYPTAITIPSDGDVPDVASVNAALEGLADRTANANAVLTPLTNVAALTAIATPTNGLTRLVANRGLYTFFTASGQPEADPESFEADDATVGRWLRQAWNTVPWSFEETLCTANQSVSSDASFNDLLTQTITDLVAGDILHVNASLAIAQTVGTQQSVFRLLITNPTPTSTNPGQIVYGPNAVAFGGGHMSAQYVVSVAGTHTIKIQGKLGVGNTTVLQGSAAPSTGAGTTPLSSIRTVIFR